MSCVDKGFTEEKCKWRIGRIEGTVIGKDGVVRGYKVRTGNGYLVKRVQLVTDLEICGDGPATIMEEKRDTRKLNPEVKEFQPRRSERKAKETARNRVGLEMY